MMKMRTAMWAILLTVLSVSTVSGADGAVGTWEAETPQGTMIVTITQGADGALSGKLESDQLPATPMDEVSLDGDTLNWKVEIDAGGQMIAMSYSGTIGGDAIDGTIDVGEFGEFPMPLTRQAAGSEGGLPGEWDLEFDIQGNTVAAKMKITKADDGSYSGTWDSEYGNSELENFKADGNSATFSRSISAQGQEMEIAYTAKAEGDAITGTLAIPQLGDVPFKGSRVVIAGPLGEWALEIDAQGQLFEIQLSVGEGSDGLTINTSTQMGDSAGTDAVFKDGTLSFVVKADAQGQEMVFTYDLKIDGDDVEGTIGSDFGDMPVTGKRAD